MSFLELSCFSGDPTDVGNLISGSSAWSKSSLNVWNFMFHVLLKHGFDNFAYYFASVWDECNCVVVWIFWVLEWKRPFPVVMYICESWAIKKAKHQRIDAFELWCWKRLLRVPWTARRSNMSILKEISPEYSLQGLMLKLKLQYSGSLLCRTD